MVKQTPLVEIIILTHNNVKILMNCLKSLKKTNYPNYKVTIVDQASSDNTFEAVKRNFPKFNIIKNKENESFSRANNKIMKRSKAKYCILLNDDTEQHPNWITEMVNVAESQKNVAAIQPKVLSLKNKSHFDYAGASGGFMDIYGYTFCRGRMFDKIERDKGQYDDIHDIFWACGVAMFLNLNVLKKIGYLDEMLETYAEEVDLSWRINLSGYRILVVPSSTIYHIGSSSWGKKKYRSKKEFLIHRNHWIILIKNYSFISLIKIMPMKIVLEVISIAGGLILRNPYKSMAITKANLWILFNFIKIWKSHRSIEELKKVRDFKLQNKMLKTSIGLRQFMLGEKLDFSKYSQYIKDY